MVGSIDARYGVSVFVEGGDIVIRQHPPLEREQVVALHPEEAEELIDLLQQALKNAAIYE